MVVSTSRTGRVRPGDWVVPGSSKSLYTTATPCRVPAAPPGSDNTTSGARLRFGHPTPDVPQLTSQACLSGPVSPSRSPRNGFPWLHHRHHWASLSLASCASLRSRIVGQGMAWQDRAGQGSDALSLADDGIAKGQTGPHPGQPGAQMAASFGLLAVSTCANGLCDAMCYFQLPYSIDAASEQDFHQAVQPPSAACRQQQRSSAVRPHESLRIRMSATLAGRLGPEVGRSPSSNHNRQWQPCKSGW
jgi:hypothetical protein